MFNGWEWSGKWFWRSGLPFSVTDAYPLLSQLFGAVCWRFPLADKRDSPGMQRGSRPSLPVLNANAFVDGANGYSTLSSQTRNQYRGPHYFNVDMNLYKTFHFGELRKLGVGVQAFNVLQPPELSVSPIVVWVTRVSVRLLTMATSPTSPYGSFLGFDSSVRIVQLSAKLIF